MEKQNCNNFGFQGPCTILCHQHFRMVEVKIRSCEATMSSAKLCLNPCAEEFAPSSDNNRTEERITHALVDDDSTIENSVGINKKPKETTMSIKKRE